MSLNQNKIDVNKLELNEQFSIYDSIMQKLFNQEDMKFTYSNYHTLLPQNTLSLISENTFYRNRQNMENDFSSTLFNPNPMFNIYYIRLKNYLFSVSKLSNNTKKDKVSILSHLEVTQNFFPLYIGLIVSYSKIGNWNNMTAKIKKSYNCFFSGIKTLYGSLLLSEAKTYYNTTLGGVR